MIPELTPEQIVHLTNLATGGLMRKITPDHIAEDFIQKGWAANKVGGLALTETGHMVFHKANGHK